MNSVDTPILEVSGLVTEFASRSKVVRAVNELSFDVVANETLGIVGESGCGKSLTSLSIMQLVPGPNGRITGGEIRFQGKDLLGLEDAEMRKIRGNEISMIFQEPLTALNPVLTIGRQLMEPLRVHRDMTPAAAKAEAIKMLDLVRIPDPERRLKQYPHELSGGMRQRVMIAMALICKPALLIADEPTTALDVTIQAQILHLMRDLKRQIGASIILITHDLGVIAEMAQRVVVMYAGRKVEEASVKELFDRPLHPYTQGLIQSIPRLGSSLKGGERTRLAEIAGVVPEQTKDSVGCAFAPRCPKAIRLCFEDTPAVREFGNKHLAACHLVEP